MKLNIGSGSLRYPEWINLDIRSDVNPDIMADVRKLPFKDNSIDEIFASHILEHTALGEDVLHEWERVLDHGGRITVAVPDLLQLYAEYRAGIIGIEYFLATIYGSYLLGDPQETHSHYQVFTPDMLAERLRPYFRDVNIGATGCPRPTYYGEVMMQGYKI